MDEYRFKTAAEDPSLLQAKMEITAAVWPEFMLHDPVADRYWGEFEPSFPEYQIFLFVSGILAGFANTIPFRWNRPAAMLPDRGWDWMLEKGVLDKRKKLEPNCLGGVQVCVKPEFQGRGLSGLIVARMKETALARGLSFIYIPARPTFKCRYPGISMKRYLEMKDSRGFLSDPWLRVHARNGGKIIKVCGKSMIIPGTIGQWEKWSGTKFSSKGSFEVKGALSKVSADPRKNRAVYVEENVWVGYDLRS